MKLISVWTLEEQNQWSKTYKKLPIGSKVKLNSNYTGDENRLGKNAIIINIITQEIDSGHIAYDEFNKTHEEYYKVTYDDGIDSVLWPEEIEVL